MFEEPVQSHYLAANWLGWESNLRPLDRKCNVLTAEPPSHNDTCENNRSITTLQLHLGHTLMAGFFMSKLTSRLPNLGYLGREVNSRVNFCRVFSLKN